LPFSIFLRNGFCSLTKKKEGAKLTIFKLTKKIWWNVAFYKRTSICLVGMAITVALYFFWDEVGGIIFAALVIWVVFKIYPSKIKRSDYDDNG